MRIISMIIGSVLAILFILHLIKGQKYLPMVEKLDSNSYPFHTLYVVGFSWSTTKLLGFKGKQAAALVSQASMLHGQRFAKFYGTLAWAQAITLAHLIATVTFLGAAILYQSFALVLICGLFTAVFCVVYSMEDMKNTLKKRTENCEKELPEVVSSMALLINSGMILRDAWALISKRGTGDIYVLMRKAVDEMNNGRSDADAIYLFGRDSNSLEIKKFTSSLIQSLEKSGNDLPAFLANQSTELWNTKKQTMLQEGEKAATKLLMPIMLIFLGVIVIIIAAAFGGSML